MLPINIRNDLIKLWKEIFNCRHCNLPEDYTPQFRPLGNSYQKNGVLFAQINPGHIGSLTRAEIEQRYKQDQSRQIAHNKQKVTSELLQLQNTFLNKPTLHNWDLLNSAYSKAVCQVWGWPPGKYGTTIKKHDASINEIALINIAQCPVPKDKYTKMHFSNCWQLHTKRLIETLKPRLIIAQGKASFNFLRKQNLTCSIILVEGNHHASRQSNEIKNQIFNNVRRLISVHP